MNNAGACTNPPPPTIESINPAANAAKQARKIDTIKRFRDYKIK